MTGTKGPDGAERDAMTAKSSRRMKDRKLTYKGIAAKAGLSPFIVTASLHGQMALPPEAAKKAAKTLGMPDAEEFLTEVPSRGSLGQAVPTDPTIYRFYELVQVYGTTLKALIHEEFGDGIMSAIDFDLDSRASPTPPATGSRSS
jgi:cyanate lyase